MQPVAISKMLSNVALHPYMKTQRNDINFSCVGLNLHSVSPSVVSQEMDLFLEFRSTTTVHFHPYFLPRSSSKNFG